MTSSNEISKKNRVNTYIAIGLACATLSVLALLYLKVAQLSETYGRIKQDIEYYESERSRLTEQRDAVVVEIARLEALKASESSSLSDLSADNQRLSETIAESQARYDRTLKSLDDLERRATDANALINTADGLRREILDLESKKNGLVQDLAESRNAKERLSVDVSGLETLKTELRSSVDSLQYELNDQRKTLNSLATRETELLKARDELNRITQSIEEKRRDQKELESTLLSINDEVISSRGEMERLSTDLTAKREEQASLQQEIKTSTERLSVLTQSRQSLESEISVLKDTLNTLQGDKANLDLALQSVKAEQSQAEQMLSTLTNTLNTTKADVERAALEKTSSEAAAEDAAKRVRLLDSQITELEAQYQTSLKRIEEGTAELQALEAQQAELSQTQATLKTLKSSLSTSQEELESLVLTKASNEAAAEEAAKRVQSLNIEIAELDVQYQNRLKSIEAAQSQAELLNARLATRQALYESLGDVKQEIQTLESESKRKALELDELRNQLTATRTELKSETQSLQRTREELSEMSGRKAYLEEQVRSLEESAVALSSDTTSAAQ